jgi:hypothetical protein
LPAITGEVGVATGEAPDALADNTAAKTDATEIPDNILSMGHSPGRTLAKPSVAR